jgi:hypothetical protein
MNKAALWLGAAGVAASFAVARPASAAEMFADVPTDHWAYQAVNNLQERGIVIGYPDGTFGGKRAMTRYEFAVAVDRLIDWVNRSISDAIAGIPKPPEVTQNPPGLSEDDVNRLIDEKIRNLPTKDDLDTIRRLTEEFRDELAALGTNVEGLRHDLDALKARVGAIEDRLNKWHFSGEANLIGRGERGQKTHITGIDPPGTSARRSAIDLDSRVDNNFTSNILQDVKTLYSLDFGITGNISSGVTANALLNFGNYLAWANANRQNPGVNYDPLTSVDGKAADASTVDPVPFGQAQGVGPIAPQPFGTLLGGGTQTQGNLGSLPTNTSFSEFTPVKLYLNSPVRDLWFLKDIDATVGKFGVQFTPYTLRKVDPDSYTSVTLTDNGEIVTTGAMGRASIGGLHLQGYAGTHYVGRAQDSSINTGDAVFTSWGGPTVLSAVTYGAYPWDQSGGVRGTYQLGRFNLGGTYISAGITPLGGASPAVPFSDITSWAGRPNSNNPGSSLFPRRAEVYGGDINFPLFGKLGFAGEFASSDVLAGTKVGDRESVFPSSLNNAYDAKLNWGTGRLSVSGGYKQVDPYFGTPGSWGNIGRWKNPTNIQGWNASAGYNFGSFSLKGKWEDYNSVRVDLNSARAGFAIPAGVTGNANPYPSISDYPSLSSDLENDIKHYSVGVSFNLNPTNAIDLGWEQARIQPFDTKNGGYLGQGGLSGETKETYWNIGLGHTFNNNTLIKVMYQIVDYKDNGAGLYTVPGGSYKGGIGVTQLSVRF